MIAAPLQDNKNRDGLKMPEYQASLGDEELPLTNRLARFVYQSQRPYTLILGAGASLSSGCSSNKKLIEEVVKRHIRSIRNLNEYQIFEKFYNFIKTQPRDKQFSIYKEFVGAIKGSKGYNYLAELIKERYFDIILTTNFDLLLEEAIYKIMKPTEFKILIREEVNDDQICKALEFPSPRVKVVKLHGDLYARIFYNPPSGQGNFSPDLKKSLKKFLKNTIIVGHNLGDSDLIECLRDSEEIWYINPEKPLCGKDKIWGILDKINLKDNIISGEGGDFDKFFHNIYQLISKFRLKEIDPITGEPCIYSLLKEVAYEEEAKYITWEDAMNGIRQLTIKAIYKFKPNLILPIYDPDSPGGKTVGEKMYDYYYKNEEHFKNTEPFPIEIFPIKIEGRRGERKVKGNEKLNEMLKTHERILIVDDVAFAGRTIKVAVDYIIEIKRPYVNIDDIKAAVLVISRKFKNRGDKSIEVFSVKSTDRCEIFLPWNWVQATGDLERAFSGVAGKEQYKVNWIKRPWGATEVFAENEFCSIKLHTISPGECLSLQTHFCRDEFFVALDENICLQIGDKYLVLEKGDYRLIPRGIKHRFYGHKDRVRVLEVAFGFYDQKGDIEREEDKYERDRTDGSI